MIVKVKGLIVSDSKKNAEEIVGRMQKAYGVKNKNQLAIAMGLSKNSVVSGWLSRGVSQNAIDQTIKETGVTEEWLLTGKGEFKPKRETISIPVVSETASAGTGSNIESVDVFDTDKRLTLDLSLFKTPPKGKLHAVEVDGYSMVPVLLPSSWVIFEESKEWSGDGLYVLVFRGVLMVKQVEVNPKTGNLWIKSANPQYDSWEYDPTQDQSTMRIVGRVLRCVI